MKYSSFEEALKHGDGLCVIGAFLEVDFRVEFDFFMLIYHFKE